MNLSLIRSNGKVNSPVKPDWQKQFEEWRELLSECGDKPTRKRVHSLRVATLRLKAEVDFWLLDQDAAIQAGDAAKIWKKHAAKLRKALSPLRDTDIQLEMLSQMRAASAGGGDKAQLSPEWLAELKKLEDELQKQRSSAQKKLLAEIGDRGARLERSSKELQDHLAALTPTPWAASDRNRAIRGLIAGLATELPTLNADNLHEFRKQAKTARYLADVSAKSDLYAARQATLLKKMQNAAGEWHDLQTLASKARDALGTSNALVKVLEQEAEESLRNALELCPRMMAQLLDQSARNGVSKEATPPKKPVQRVEAIALKGDRRYA
jgi:CHAD domain-containing protein